MCYLKRHTHKPSLKLVSYWLCISQADQQCSVVHQKHSYLDEAVIATLDLEVESHVAQSGIVASAQWPPPIFNRTLICRKVGRLY